ncbi:MAG TPA: response regulator transcription factor [Syntrophorhabdaceae bacterium]|nr:response regulator transcription factor [Syntrophorhabdaceae bacterium]
MKVLLVEDESKVANFISRGLEEEGYSVDTASDGRMGLELINGSAYDIVLLDLMIPEIDGLEVLKRIRANGIDTPVLIITAKDSKEDVIKGLDTGSDDYLTKPFSFEELLARIRALLRRSKKTAQLTLEYGDVVLNPYYRKLAIGPKETELTEKEFLIMEYMLKNTEKPITRKEIAEYAWQSQDDSSNIVDVYINFLRKKIETLSSKKYIHTVRGTGYILKEDDDKD